MRTFTIDADNNPNRRVDKVRESKGSDGDLNNSQQRRSPTDQSPAGKEPSLEGNSATRERRKRGERDGLVVLTFLADPEEAPPAVN